MKILDKEFQVILNPWVDDVDSYFIIEKKKTVYRNFVNNVLRKKKDISFVDSKGLNRVWTLQKQFEQGAKAKRDQGKPCLRNSWKRIG